MNLGSLLLGARNPKAHHTEGQLRVAQQSYANSAVRNVMGQANLRSPCSLTISLAVLLIQLDCGSAHADGANRLTAGEGGGWLAGWLAIPTNLVIAGGDTVAFYCFCEVKHGHYKQL